MLPKRDKCLREQSKLENDGRFTRLYGATVNQRSSYKDQYVAKSFSSETIATGTVVKTLK